jgi:ribulose-phosphate 3-epimerase
MPESIGRLERLRSLAPEGMRVQVDGGVNAETIERVRAAGADLLVVGSAIFWHDHPPAEYGRLAALVAERVQS